jgi:hypothetical protein
MAVHDVTLTWSEMFTACMVGVVRRLSSIAKRYNKNKHAEISNFQTDIEGAIAEQCFAKFKSLYWSCSVNTFKEPDVDTWQVRSSGHLNGHCIVRPNDKSGYRVAFLTVPDDRFGANLVGWIETDDAKVDRYWRPDKNGWWVPQSDLHPFELGDPDELAA